LEQACAKFLVNEMLGFEKPVQLIKDEFGKPHIQNSSIAISFSHCKKFLACSIDLDGNSVGIDIEIQRDNIRLLAKKFISEFDNSPLKDDAHAQLIWGAKEVLYKIYGRKSIDFKRDLEINYTDKLIGKIKKENELMEYNLDYTIIDCHFLVWNS
jgi:4'-phosphopantetheinyl transferase